MTRLLFTRAAEIDLEEIHDFIAADRPSAASRLLDRLEKCCWRVAQKPGLGRSRPELAQDLRSTVVGNYIIFYRPIAGGVEVIRILHGARDIDRLIV